MGHPCLGGSTKYIRVHFPYIPCSLDMHKCMHVSLLCTTFLIKLSWCSSGKNTRQTIKTIWKFAIVSNSSSLSALSKLVWKTRPLVCFDWPLSDTISRFSCQQLKFNEDLYLFPQIFAASPSATVDSISRQLVTQAYQFTVKFTFEILCSVFRAQLSLLHHQLSVLYKPHDKY